jgi:membrane-associated protein
MEHLIHFNMSQWVSTIGYVGILFIIFAETGLFFGFFFPGDSLIFTAGLLAAKGMFKIEILVPALIVVAIAGYFTSYWIGSFLEHWFRRQKDSWWFKKRYLSDSHEFYNRHGGKSLILGRLLPIVRTFVPVVAGIAKMKFSRFIFFNIVGAIFWAGGITMLGYCLGNILPQSERLILPIVLLIIVLSILPGVWHVIKQRYLKS